MRKILKYLLVAFVMLLISEKASAQFREDAFKQNYANTADADSTSSKSISISNLFRGLAGKEEMKIGSMFMGSMILPGTAQIYQKQYWKLPVFYACIGVPLGLGIYYNNRNRALANGLFVAAGASYWAMQLDAALCYKKDVNPLPGRATLLSILFPGAGQIYNHEYWKVPLYQGGIALCTHFIITNNTNYVRYRDIYINSTQPGYQGQISSDVALYYRNTYRRLRDYSIVAVAVVYLLQVIDANVFAYMGNFEVTDDITMQVSPSVMPYGDDFAMSSPRGNSVGMSLSVRF